MQKYFISDFFALRKIAISKNVLGGALDLANSVSQLCNNAFFVLWWRVFLKAKIDFIDLLALKYLLNY